MNTPARQLLVLLSLVFSLAPSPALSDSGPPPLDKPEIVSSYGKLPLYFMENDGQVDGRVRYYEKGLGHATYFTGEGVWLNLVKKEGEAGQSPEKGSRPGSFKSESIRLSFIGANENPEIIALDEQAGKVNYFKGNDPAKWRSNVPTFASVLYKEVWPGIDLRFYGNNQTLEYDIIVKPGADPDVVKFSYEGIEGLKVADSGDMEIILKHGKIVQKKPYVYQEIDGKRMEVAGSFVVSPIPSHQSPVPDSYSFAMASYDRTKPLVIDPYIIYSTYLGDVSEDGGEGIAVDSSGNVYVTGYTYSAAFPTTVSSFDGACGGCTAAADAFVAKINAAGSALVYSTYLGGSNNDLGYAIAVDSSGNAYVTGVTSSSNFPTASPFDGALGGAYDAFVTKLNASGSALVYSTYLGGSGYDSAGGIAVDSLDYAHVIGETQSGADFPVTVSAFDETHNGGMDAFITRFDFAGTGLGYSTFLGGSLDDYGKAIALDTLHSAYVTGYTISSNFPTTASAFDEVHNGLYDVFVAEIDISGSTLMYSTYAGGSSADYGMAIALDLSSNAYVTGKTASSDFPTQAPIDGGFNGVFDAFVVKVNPAGSGLVYSTYLGGVEEDFGAAIAVDTSGNAYVAGGTMSGNFPTTPSAIDSTCGGCPLDYDAFVTRINSGGTALSFSTYLGGGDLYADSDIVRGIAILPSGGAVFMVGETGTHESEGFPTVSPIDGTYGGYGDAFVVKMTTVNTVPSLSYSTETGYSTDGVNPNIGTASNTITYKVVYTDADNNAPNSPDVHIDGNVAGVSMTLDATASATLRDGDYTNGEQYKYSTTLAAGNHTYYFTASDGTDSVRLPSSGTLSGPDISDLTITTSTLLGATLNVPYSQTLIASGGTTPYTWGIASGLPPGLSLDVSTGVISGTPTTAGTYGFTATVTDSGAYVYSKSLSITVAVSVSGVDLVISAISAPSTAKVGAVVSITATGVNRGTADAGRFHVGVYLSTDTVITGADTYIGTLPVWNGLAAGQSATVSLSHTIPTTLAPGAYYVGAIADIRDVVSESNETNNANASAVLVISSAVDLTVAMGSVTPTSVKAGNAVSAPNTVTNSGTSASPTFYVNFYLSTDTTITGADTYLGHRPVWGLDAGGISSATTSLTIPFGTVPGTYYIGAMVDPANTVAETNETNNTAASAAIAVVVSGVDLTVSIGVSPVSADAGSRIGIPNAATNSGTTDSERFYVGYYLSTDATITTSDIYLGYSVVQGGARGGLDAGATAGNTIYVTIPAAVSAGAYYLGAIADVTARVPESNETNNTDSNPIAIVNDGIDLVMDWVYGLAHADTGTLTPVSFTVTNQGTADSPPFYVGIYLSDNTTISPWDTYLGYYPIWNGLAAGASLSDTASFIIPTSLAAGNYYVGASADFTGIVLEGDEFNNERADASGPTNVGIGVDIEPTAVDFAPQPGGGVCAGGVHSFTSTVRNAGSSVVRSDAFWVEYFLSDDADITVGDDPIGGYWVWTGLVGGEPWADGPRNLQIPNGINVGDYFVGVIADRYELVPESDEGDNDMSTVGNIIDKITIKNCP